MTEWTPVSVGKSGARVWRGRGVYRKEDAAERVGAEAARLVWLADQGLPCPRVLDLDDGVMVTSDLPGHPASWHSPHLRPRLVGAYAEVLQALHQLPVSRCPFDETLDITTARARQAVTARAVDLDDLGAVHCGWSVEGLWDLLVRTRPAGEDLVVCHGDPTVANILFDESAAVTGVLDVDRLGVADRYRDLAIATRSLAGKVAQECGDALAGCYSDELVDQTKLAFYRLLDEFF